MATAASMPSAAGFKLNSRTRQQWRRAGGKVQHRNFVLTYTREVDLSRLETWFAGTADVTFGV